MSLRGPGRALGAALLGMLAACGTIPETGSGMAGVDRTVRQFMARWDVPGLALAVVKDGRLVLARGYGFADPERGEPVRPDSRFRIASASKPVTAVAVMTLVESGELGLDAPVFRTLLAGYLDRCRAPDPRLRDMTVRHLLLHASGWDTSEDIDPMFNAARIARRLDAAGLSVTESVIQRLACSPLDHEPGTEHVYENVNYAVLGRVIEAVAGMPYEDYVRERVFAPLGIRGPRIGHALSSGRLPGEVRYVARGGDRRRVTNAVSDDPGTVPLQYGGFDLQAMDSHGGWVASAPDLARLLAGIDRDPSVPDLLARDAVERMGANPGSPLFERDARLWYAMGWYRTRAGAWLHDGSLPGSAAFIGMEPDGLLYAALVNTRRPGPAFAAAFRNVVRSAVQDVRAWPAHDLFPEYGYAVAPETSGGKRP